MGLQREGEEAEVRAAAQSSQAALPHRTSNVLPIQLNPELELRQDGGAGSARNDPRRHS